MLKIVDLAPDKIQRRILMMRGVQVMLDRDLAELYGVPVKRLNEQVRRNRFLIIDDKELSLIGASLKDLGSKCFAFTKLDAGEIQRIKKSAFGAVAKAKSMV